MAEAIVDLVATGRTLRENGLVEIEELLNQVLGYWASTIPKT